jgi:hypothetical protein
MRDGQHTEDCVGCLPVMSLQAAMTHLCLGRKAMSRLLAEGDLVRLGRSTVVGRCRFELAVEDRRARHLLRLRALLDSYPESYASHQSAVLLRSLPSYRLPDFPVVTRGQGAWRGGSSRVRIAWLPPHHTCEVAGLPALTLERTVLDVCRSSDVYAAVVLGDAALRSGCTRESLERLVDECRGRLEVGKAMRWLPLFDARAESALESISRLTMHACGLPAPVLQQPLVGADGRTYRADFYWQEAKLIGEADGLMKYDGEGGILAGREEKLRQHSLEVTGHRFVRWTYPEMTRSGLLVCRRIAAALGTDLRVRVPEWLDTPWAGARRRRSAGAGGLA